MSQLPQAADLSAANVSKVLLVTVGGSPQPIVEAMLSHHPDYLVFFCSAARTIPAQRGTAEQVQGTGKVCSDGFGKPPSLPNIRIQAGMEHLPYDIVIVDIVDDLQASFSVMRAALDELQQRFPRAALVADYTGGTKTMAAALACACSDSDGMTLSVVSGERTNLVKVEDKTQVLVSMNTRYFQAHRELRHTRRLAEVYDYAGVHRLCKAFPRESLDQGQARTLHVMTILSRVFDAWDRFDHAEALQLLVRNAAYRGLYLPHYNFLQGVCSSRRSIDPAFDINDALGEHQNFGEGYEIVEDLLLNAERRAHNGRYDDAMGRLYRATEMLMQVYYLRRYGIDTSNVDIDKVPEAARTQVSRNPFNEQFQLGLRSGYDLLEFFAEDPLWPVYVAWRDRLIGAMKMRNESLFAHGFQPIASHDYRTGGMALRSFITDAITQLVGAKKRRSPPVQLPQNMLDVALTVKS